jgi:Flp pilus assembly protein TadD
LGICYQDEGDNDNARRMYSKAVELQPGLISFIKSPSMKLSLST